jgi:prepilin peptidase CpaA
MLLAVPVIVVAMCVASDLRSFRIPNALTGPAMCAGLAINAWFFGWAGVQASLEGFGLALLLLIGPFALGGIGGGDVKMMGAVGAFIGPRLLLYSLLIGMALGGVFAVVQLARMARLREKVANLGQMLGNSVLMRSLEPLKMSADGPGAVVLPYSVPLGLGTLAAIAMSATGRL